MAIVVKKPIAAKLEAPAVATPPAANGDVKSSTPSWMMQGKATVAAYAAEKAKSEVAYENSKKLHRFRLKVGEARTITFIDGFLDDDGMLAARSYYEHTVPLGARYENFVCLAANHVPGQPQEPCPICEASSDNRPSLVTVLTVLDHTPYTIQKGPKQGQVIPFQRKLFVAKGGTMEKLRYKANKMGGLAGWTFSAARIGDNKSPAAGNEFDRDEEQARASTEELIAQFAEDGKVADYEAEIVMLSAAKLIELGAGKAPAGPGYGGSKFDSNKMGEQI